MTGDGDVVVRGSDREALPSAVSGEVQSAPSSRCIVGLIDDDPAVRRALVRLLVASGYAAAPFASAEEFLSWGRTHTLCCLILDVELSRMSGPELYGYLLASGEDLPVIFISAVADAASLIRLHTGVVAEVLSKPIDGDHLCDVIARALVRSAV